MTSKPSSPDPDAPWDDAVWREKSDTRWQAGLRRQQTWWRQVIAKQPAGPQSKTPGSRLVGSMLPLDVALSVNLMSAEARSAYERAKDDMNGRPGIIQEDRLRRNTLSSQPLCFNLFGHLASAPESLLPWVRTIDPDAEVVTDVRLEWAPEGTNAGSAFDAFVDYATGSGARRFVGVETKYHENLRATLRKDAGDKFLSRTTTAWWRDMAASRLDVTGLRQFWFNQLLTQRTVELESYDRGFGVVVACDEDQAARDVCEKVAAELKDPSELSFHSIQSVAESVPGHDEWRAAFVQRYTDFTPIRSQLTPGDPRIRN